MAHAPERWVAPKESEQPEPGRMGRRLFGKVMTAGAAALFTPRSLAQEPGRLDVHRFAEHFPEPQELRGIDAIATHMRAHARYLLIHLHIIHWHDEETDPEDIHQVRVCQSQWKKGLESLIEHPYTRLESVYAEGKHSKSRRLFSEPQDVEAIVDAHPSTRSSAPLPHKENAHITRRGMPLLITRGADYALEREHKLRLDGIEWPDTQQLCAAACKHDWPDKDTYIFDVRERAALEIIAANRTQIAYVFYGAAHDWNPTIDAWNQEYPQHTFSLMNIYPDCMIDDQTQQRVYFEDPRRKRRKHVSVPLARKTES